MTSSLNNGFDNTGKNESVLCDEAGIKKGGNDGATSTVCREDSSPKNCDVYVIKGRINGTSIITCTGYCEAYGLWCLKAFEDEHSDCRKEENVLGCDDEFTRPSAAFYYDNICSCGRTGD